MIKQKCRYKKFLRDKQEQMILVEGKANEYQFEWVDGILLEFGVDCVEYESNAVSFSTAIIELENGMLINVPVEDVQMVNEVPNIGELKPDCYVIQYETTEDGQGFLTVCPYFREKSVGSSLCKECAFFRGKNGKAFIYCAKEPFSFDKTKIRPEVPKDDFYLK